MNEDVFHYYYVLSGHNELLIFTGIQIFTGTATCLTRVASLLSVWFLLVLSLHSGILLLIQTGFWIAVKKKKNGEIVQWSVSLESRGLRTDVLYQCDNNWVRAWTEKGANVMAVVAGRNESAGVLLLLHIKMLYGSRQKE